MGNQILKPEKVFVVRKVEGDVIHNWFELSYAQYLTIPRSVLQSMPDEWQQRFVKCLEELDETIDWRPKSGRYWVKLKDDDGKYVHDDLMDYERGRRKIPHIENIIPKIKDSGEQYLFTKDELVKLLKEAILHYRDDDKPVNPSLEEFLNSKGIKP